MFRFAQEEALFGLIIIPLLVILLTVMLIRRKRAMAKFASPDLENILMPQASRNRYLLKFILLAFSLGLLIIALAGPRVGSSLKEVQKKGREIIIALDVSNSMLANDADPNRLEMAKRSLNRLLTRMEDDKIGLIVFAGDAYTQIPITNDYGAARLFLNTVSTDMVSKQGTAIGKAIELASRSFSPESDNPESPVSMNSRAVIIITDGENHEEGAFDAAEEAAEKGITLHTVGLGNPAGVPLPVSEGSREYRRDREGSVVVSRLDETTLKRIASIADGFYVRAGRGGAGIVELLDRLDEMEGEEYTAKVYADYEERYQYFLGAGLLLLLAELLIMDKKNKWLQKIKLFG